MIRDSPHSASPAWMGAPMALTSQRHRGGDSGNVLTANTRHQPGLGEGGYLSSTQRPPAASPSLWEGPAPPSPPGPGTKYLNLQAPRPLLIMPRATAVGAQPQP